LIITNQSVIEPSGSFIKLEYDIFQSNEAVTVSDLWFRWLLDYDQYRDVSLSK
jgi:hypothetical protein